MGRSVSKVKRPVNAFPKCACWMHKSFLSVHGIHVFCGFCGWDSVEAYAEAGGYDVGKYAHPVELTLGYGMQGGDGASLRLLA